MAGFTMAENISDARRHFERMNHDQLVEQCISAQELIGPLVQKLEEAERNLTLAIAQGRDLERLVRGYQKLFASQAGALKSGSSLTGPKGRFHRKALLALIEKAAAFGDGAAIPEIFWPDPQPAFLKTPGEA